MAYATDTSLVSRSLARASQPDSLGENRADASRDLPPVGASKGAMRPNSVASAGGAIRD
ncbi:MAG: hypothetical protein L3K18_05550 [Thermoplasmata archaeon]|nr:hypothetical protein [Thermoplasmata archaeon]MCI4356591.1 hypothetical protein [Thermoplasmata archaeon]